MVRKLVDILRQHYRLGYAPALLWLDAILISFLLLDAIRFQRFGLPFQPILWLSTDGTFLQANAKNIVILCFWLMLILPAVIAFGRIVGLRFNSGLSTRLVSRRTILAFQVMLSAFLVYGVVLAYNAQTLSGLVLGDQDILHPAFESYTYMGFTSPYLSGMISILGTALTSLLVAALGYIVFGKELAKPVEQYITRAELADLPTELRPTSHIMNPAFRGRSMVHIEATHREARAFQKRLLNSGTTSQKSIDYLDELFSECQRIINDKVIRRNQAAAVQVRLFTGQKRAMEASLSIRTDIDAIIVSPFASPSLLDLLQWHSKRTRVFVETIEFQPNDFLRPWEVQQQQILQSLTKFLEKYSKIIFCVSEVCYATGLRLPLGDFLSRIETLTDKSTLNVVVDGTNAVGNRSLVNADFRWDAYVFSPHRWLMAPESCGILLTRSDTQLLGIAPGVWQFGAKKSDAQVRIITGLRSSLELLNAPGFEYFQARSEQLKEEFKLTLPNAVRIVGDKSGLEETFIMSCYPDIVWRAEINSFEERLRGISVCGSVLRLKNGEWWFRLAIPYFTDLRDLILTCDLLKSTAR